MAGKKFCRCKCFMKTNIFLKDVKTHAVFENESQFLRDYSQLLKDVGLSPLDVLEQVKVEVLRRKNLFTDSLKRKYEIAAVYSPLHPDIKILNENYIDPVLKEIHKAADHGQLKEMKIKMVSNEKKRYYSFPVFIETFCDKLVEELKNFENSASPKGRPNSMNRYGIILEELGFNEEFLTPFREKYIEPIAKLLWPECVGDGLDTHKAFTVKYKMGEDEELTWHHDNAEVTLNVSLTDTYEGGDLYIGPMSEDRDKKDSVDQYVHKKGWGIMHRGLQMHGAMPIEEGERYNLIIWNRSSSIRNRKCPMCTSAPDLEPVEDSWGDGFTC